MASNTSTGTGIGWLFSKYLLYASFLLSLLATLVYLAHSRGLLPPVAVSVNTYDGQSLIALVSLVIGGAVALAGAYVVISLAKTQEGLTHTQIEISKRQTAEYEATYVAASQAAGNIKYMLALGGMVLATYRQLRTNPTELFSSTSSPLAPLLERLRDVCSQSWAVDVFDYAQGASHKARINVQRNLAQIHFRSNKMVLMLTAPRVEVDQQARAFDSMTRQTILLIIDIYTFGQSLLEARSAWKTHSPDPMQEPSASGFLHAFLAPIKDGDFLISMEARTEIMRFMRALDPDSLPLQQSGETDGLPPSFAKMLNDVLGSTTTKCRPVRINQMKGASEALEIIRDAVQAWAKKNQHSYRFVEGVRNREEMADLRMHIDSAGGNAVTVIYVNALGGNPDWLFQFHESLDKCIVILDGLPVPTWTEQFKYVDFENYSSWDSVLRLLAFTAIGRTHSTYPAKVASPTRTLWVGLQELPDYADLDEIRAFQESSMNSFGAMFTRATNLDGGTYIHI